VVTALAEIEGCYAVEVVNDMLQSPAAAEANGAGAPSDAESIGLRRA
jgi:hypothetical protein